MALLQYGERPIGTAEHRALAAEAMLAALRSGVADDPDVLTLLLSVRVLMWPAMTLLRPEQTDRVVLALLLSVRVLIWPASHEPRHKPS